MRIEIDVATGRVDTATVPDYASERLVLFGQIDRLHGPNGAPWHPAFSETERYLEAASPGGIPRSAPSVEGQYLALWRDGPRTYVFGDRYCLRPVYYRVSSGRLELFDRILGRGYHLSVPRANAIAFVLFRYVPGRATLFDGIRQLMPGDCLVLDSTDGSLSVEVGCVYPRRNHETPSDEVAMAERLHALFREALEMRLRRHGDNEPLLLPVSGGLDSRYTLGTALELVPASRIVAMTFGQPGSYDFEIGRAVAVAAGVRHVAYPLSPSNYRAEALAGGCRDCDGQISFALEAPIEVFQEFAQFGSVTLSGYVGDAIMGNKAHPEGHAGRAEIALKDAVVRPGDPLAEHLSRDLVEESFYYENGVSSPLDPAEMWFFVNHFTKYSTYCVFKLRDDFAYINPFVDYAFADYVLNLPAEMRVNRRLYFSWLRRAFPRLAEVPCALYRGAPFNSSPPRRFVAHQWDRCRRYLLGVNRRVNKIDFERHLDRLVQPAGLRQDMRGVLPTGFEDRVFGNSRYAALLYNIKCLQVLKAEYGVELA